MDPILGQIILWPVPWVPDGWALCDGSLLNVNNYQALYSIIGNTYGGTPGVNFAVPDLRNRVPMGTISPTQVGVTAGSATSSATAIGAGAATITINNLPAHTHNAAFTPSGGSASVSIGIPVVPAPSSASVTPTPGATVSLAQVVDSGPDTVSAYSSDAPTTTLKPFSVSVPGGGGSVAVANTGNGQPLPVQVLVPVTVSTMQPSIAMNYIIALVGVYPPRP
jgi:microcystin-dependent protein